MGTIGLDLHKRESRLCVLTEAGEILERRWCADRDESRAVLGGRAPARIVLEASTESEWVAQHLEALGHEVIVPDPNFAPMCATRRHRVKTEAPPSRDPPLRRRGVPSSYESANRKEETLLAIEDERMRLVAFGPRAPELVGTHKLA